MKNVSLSLSLIILLLFCSCCGQQDLKQTSFKVDDKFIKKGDVVYNRVDGQRRIVINIFRKGIRLSDGYTEIYITNSELESLYTINKDKILK